MGIIKESFQLTATDADILAAPSRLAAIPENGSLLIEVATTDCDATNFGQLTLQLPGGEVPFENLIIPFNGRNTSDSVMDKNLTSVFLFEVKKGGHVLVQYTENGTVTLAFFIFTLQFKRG